jgi:Ca2+-dependent lipid-binding protein
MATTASSGYTAQGGCPLSIQVISAQFMVDLGRLSKQDPYIRVKIGAHSESTTSKTRAGKSAIWDETLRFEKLEGVDHLVHIWAQDKNLLGDNIIGKTTLPLSELLRQHGQREIDLFDVDSNKLTGHVLMAVTGGEGLLGQSLTSGHHGDLGTDLAAGAGVATGGQLAGHSYGPHDSQNLIIQVISAQFTHDMGTMSRQDPFLKITVGHETEKTSSKSRAGLSAVWNETLTFTKLERLPEGKSCDVIISAWDKDVIKNDEIGNVKIPLSELLRNQGQQCEYNLYDIKDTSQIAGRVLLCVSLGEGLGGKHHGLGVGGLPGLVEHGTTGTGTMGTPGGMGAVSTGLGTTMLGAGHDGGRHGGMGSTGMGSTGMGAGHGMDVTGRSTGMGQHSGTGLPGQHGLGNLAIIVNSAHFLHDQGIISKQDPYIMITIGDQTLKTKAKSNAGKTAVWNETLTFTDLGRLEFKSQTVLIRALDKDMIMDDDIGRVVIPLSELLSSQGQREYELFTRGDLSKSVGRVLLTISDGSLGSAGMIGMGRSTGSTGATGSTY